MNKRKIITSKQFGFLKRRSAESQLLMAVENWKMHADKGYQVDVIYIDLKKAFDKVPHRRLLYKLRNLGLGTTVDCIEQFLIGRSQTV
jgi:RNA-binding protein YlmH